MVIVIAVGYELTSHTFRLSLASATPGVALVLRWKVFLPAASRAFTQTWKNRVTVDLDLEGRTQ